MTKGANTRKPIKNIHLKYVDGLTIAESMRLKNVLSVENDRTWERPIEYHNRTEQELHPEDSQVQAQLSELEQYARTNQMKVNHKNLKSCSPIHQKRMTSVLN